MDQRPVFFTAKNVTTGIVCLVLIILIIGAPAIGAEKEVIENTKPSPSGWGFSGIIILVGIGSLIVFILKLSSSKAPAYDWIPLKDRIMIEKLITDHGKEGIELFIQVINQYGPTGYIKRLGLSGLPLLTVILTLIFSFLGAFTWIVGLYFVTNPATDITAAVMDLAKLTLGAFIGSFVQRNVSEGEKPSHDDHAAPAHVDRATPAHVDHATPGDVT